MFPVSAALLAANPEYEWFADVCPRSDADLHVHRRHRGSGSGSPHGGRHQPVPEVPCGLALSARQHPGGQREHVRHVPQPGIVRAERPHAAWASTASEAYDGLVGQTYELKTMLHRIHSAGESTVDAVRHLSDPRHLRAGRRSSRCWARTGRPCRAYAAEHDWWSPGLRGDEPAAAVPASCSTSTSRPIRGVAEGLQGLPRRDPGHQGYFPNPTKAVATTLNAGGTTWKTQTDDTLQGASAASCVTCHTRTPT